MNNNLGGKKERFSFDETKLVPSQDTPFKRY